MPPVAEDPGGGHGEVSGPAFHQRTGQLAEVLVAAGFPAAVEPRGWVDHGLTQTRETRPREAGWRATVPDSSCLRHQGLAQGRTGDRDQSEAVDRAVVGTDRQPTTVLAHRHPDQRLTAVPTRCQGGPS